MTDHIIEINDLSFQYQTDKPVIENLTLAIKKGETIGLVGSNGAGKSSLLKLLVGIHTHNTGTLKICNHEMNLTNLQDIRSKIGFSFQDSDSQLFMTSVYEDVAFGPRNQGLSEDEVHLLVEESLRKVQALELSERPPYNLSGGEKKAVALATVLSMKPEIIVLDEPTTGLDPKSRRNLISILNSLQQTKIIATHDMDMALELCDRVVVMHHGKLVIEGSPNEVFAKKETIEACHLEQPLTMQTCIGCGSNKL